MARRRPDRRDSRRIIVFSGRWNTPTTRLMSLGFAVAATAIAFSAAPRIARADDGACTGEGKNCTHDATCTQTGSDGKCIGTHEEWTYYPGAE